MNIAGIAYQDQKTKRLITQIPKRGIAVIAHQDIDSVAAESLIRCRVKAVINLETSMTGRYDHNGVKRLIDAGIPVFDASEPVSVDLNKRKVSIKQDRLYYVNQHDWVTTTKLVRYTQKLINERKNLSWEISPQQFDSFVHNTVNYVNKELTYFTKNAPSFLLFKEAKDREVLIVARGEDYQKDIEVVRPHINKKEWIIIAVDGAADALLQRGISPNYIIGDMDSVSDKALCSGAKLITHRYLSGSSPAEVRLQKMNMKSDTVCFIGTSEDVALIFAYWSKAKKIFTIGCRTSMNEFLEKGRAGMGSSVLARMQAGHKIVDLKGIHHLYKENPTFDKVSLSVAVTGGAVVTMFMFNPKAEILVNILWNWLKVG